MPDSINRRQLLLGASSVAVASTLPGCFGPDDQEIVRPEGVPIGPFGKDSTAEEVTAVVNLTGKTVVITGCNSGLGYESMRVLSSRGAHVIGAARTLEKAANACASVDGRATPVVCELTDLDSVVTCGETIRAMDLPIDILMLNAGIMALPELEQVRGIEKQFFVNHVGHFVLANHLVPSVVDAPAGRVVVVSSSGHRFAPDPGIEFDNLSGERDYEPWKMYGVSKLANGLFSLELSKRLQGTSATSNAIHPGIINTNLGRQLPWYTRVAASLIGWTFMKSVEAGAATQCYVATAPALADVSGKYFADCNPLRPDPRMEDEAQAAKLWAVTEELASGYLA